MTTDERRAQMVIGLKLMREVVDDIRNEAVNAGEAIPDDYEIWRRAGFGFEAWSSRMVELVRSQTFTSSSFRPTPRERG